MLPAILTDDTVKLGNLEVSALGFGTLGLMTKAEDEHYARDAFAEARTNGVNLIDTAEAYGFGNIERLLNRVAIRDGGGKDLHIASKFTPLPWRPGARSVVEACEGSCQRLGVESISLYQMHFPDSIQPLGWAGVERRKDEQYWEGLAECYHRGLVKNVGVSNYGPELLERAQEALGKRGVPLTSNQIDFSLLNRRPGTMEVLAKSKELGLAVMGYFPLASGLLTGAIDEDNLPPFPRSVTMGNLVRAASPLLAELRRIAGERGKTVAQVSLNWIMCQGVIPVPGIQFREHAADNAGSLGWRLTDEECTQLEAAADAAGDPYGRWVDCSIDFLG